MRALCRLSDLPEGAASGFPPPEGGFIGLFAVKQAGRVYVYLNSCPHLGVSLDWAPDEFLDAAGKLIICATHGAEFRIEDGVAISGPCVGNRLIPVAFQIEDGNLLVSADAGL